MESPGEMGTGPRRQRARANVIERCSPIDSGDGRGTNGSDGKFAGDRSALTSEPGLYRFYLQLIADFSGRILVRSNATLSSLCPHLFAGCCTADAFLKHG